MTPRPGTLVLDDGELTDVRRALEELGVEYTYLRGGAAEGVKVELPRRLLVATPRRALALAERIRGGGPDGARGPVRIVVADGDSVTLRAQLRRVGFDYLVRRPLHPGALRLVLLRALYRGPERRVSVRYPIGGEVLYRTGVRRRRATLLEVSLRGCRLHADRAFETDTRIHVILPKSFTGSAALTLSGWVLRCSSATEGGFEIAVAFEALSAGAERALRAVMKRKIQALGAIPPAAASAAADGADLGDRRTARRAAFDGEVRAVDRGARALVGRNLSIGGLLVEQNLDLRLGDEVTLEVFGREDEEPFRVRARVTRDDEAGMALEFIDVSEPVAARLEALVAALPSVERLADSEAEAMGTVVAEILDER